MTYKEYSPEEQGRITRSMIFNRLMEHLVNPLISKKFGDITDPDVDAIMNLMMKYAQQIEGWISHGTKKEE